MIPYILLALILPIPGYFFLHEFLVDKDTEIKGFSFILVLIAAAFVVFITIGYLKYEFENQPPMPAPINRAVR
jgi:hypothetical protein